MDALRTFYTRKLDQSKVESSRNLTFALARNGQVGGSNQIDNEEEFARRYSEGVLDVDRKARGAGADLEAADQDARARLISLATTGLDATTAAQQASAAMRTNLEAGRSTAMAQGIGDVFGQFKTFSDRAREASERRRANKDAGFGLYAPMGGQ